jgi:hypothetical protein
MRVAADVPTVESPLARREYAHPKFLLSRFVVIARSGFGALE